MIEILIDHSYADDYFQIDTITVNLDDKEEKERIEKLVKQYGLEGQLVDPERELSKLIAEVLKVDESLIDLDTNEIDLM
jgi:benzoyl-CoA reductase/2-hydroxyglutaryl-CoA dehydratase subunit BcrC/BadD/HgdB